MLLERCGLSGSEAKIALTIPVQPLGAIPQSPSPLSGYGDRQGWERCVDASRGSEARELVQVGEGNSGKPFIFEAPITPPYNAKSEKQTRNPTPSSAVRVVKI